MTKKLTLKRESLTELTGAELTAVVAGQEQLLTHISCNPTDECGHGPSFDERCPTTPINFCLSIPSCIQTI